MAAKTKTGAAMPIEPTPKSNTKEYNYRIEKLLINDVDYVYNKLYCKNHAVIDYNIGDWPILLAGQHCSKDEFLEIINDTNTSSFILKERKYQGGYCHDDKIGCLCYEKLNKEINLVFWEAVNDSIDVYTFLLKYVLNNLMAKKKENPDNYFNKLNIEVEDGQWNKIKTVLDFKFQKEKTVSSPNKDDVYLYAKTI